MKKQFWIGLIAGVVTALFLGCVAICVDIVFLRDEREAKNVIKKALEEQGDLASTNENAGTGGASLQADEERPPFAADGLVLSDEDVVNKMIEIEKLIDENYIEAVYNEEFAEAIYDGMLAALNDPYAAYYSPEEFQKLMESTEGIYYGIGAYLQLDVETSYPKITGFIDGSPAADSSLRVDDYIIAVGGKDIYGMDLSSSVALIKGEEGTQVTLTIARTSTGEKFDVTLTRKKVESPTVNYKMYEDKIAYIQITEFDVITVDQFREALNQAKQAGMKGLVLDLRGNPGGSLSAAVQIGNMLLPEGLVVYTEDKYGKRTEYKSDGKNEIDVPMVVLVDGGSASAAEILAGAIKDYGVGTLMGTTTYGKGIVQRIIDLKDGSAVKMTISHYYTPNGNDIHKVGIEPDVVVEFDSEAYLENKENDNQLNKAIEYLKK